MSKYTIAWLPGDGIGKDVMDATRLVLDRIKLDFSVPETFLAMLAPGLEVETQVAAYPGREFSGRVVALTATEANIKNSVQHADLLIGAVLVPGAKAPKLVTRDMLSLMKEGAVIVDVAVDQGGCVETIRPTTHAEPTYVVDGVVHYGVANMPGAVPRTSTFALTNQTLPYVLKLAEKGLDALLEDAALLKGLNTHKGRLTHPGVAEAFGLPYTPPEEALRG